MKNKIGFKETLEWYKQNSTNYTNKISEKQHPFLINRFLKLIPKYGSILDAGCAGGRDCRTFKNKGFSPIGIDAVSTMVNLAKQKNQDLEFIHGDFRNLPFSDSYFDGIWAHASLLHLETIKDVKQTLKEFFRVLKKQGVAHIFVKKQLGKEKFSNVSQEYSDEFSRFFRWFNKEELITLLEEANLKILKIDDNYIPENSKRDIKWIAALVKKNLY